MGCCGATNNACGPLNYSKQIGPVTPGESRIIRHPDSVDKLLSATALGHTTVYQAFKHAISAFADKPCFGTRKNGDGPYEWITYAEVGKRATDLGAGLCDLIPQITVDGENYSFVGVHSKNRMEWMIADIACSLHGLINVPFYDTLGEDTITYILEQTEMELVVSSEEITPKIMALVKAG